MVIVKFNLLKLENNWLIYSLNHLLRRNLITCKLN